MIRALYVFCVGIALLASTSPVAALEYNPTVCYGYQPGEDYSAACLEMMAAYPEPVVVQIPPDSFTLTNYSYWQIGPHAVNLYDAPNGNIVGQMPPGFNFVLALDVVDGWVQIEGGQWVREEDTSYSPASRFRGVRILDGLQYPFAWVLDTTGLYTSAYPDGPQDVENGRLLLRYDLVNIFAEYIDEDGWVWYMVGPDQWIEQRFVAVAKRIERPEGVTGRWVSVDLYEQTLVAYEDDTPVFATLVSSGVPPNDTNEGLFTVWARLERDGMSGATGAPDAYALQSVPWVMYFDGSISLHGTYWHDLFGYRHSRGCVNLSISDASFLFDWTENAPPNEDGEIVTYVYVYSSGEYGERVMP